MRGILASAPVLRSSALLLLLVLALSLTVPAQQKQLTEEEKRRLFLKAREEMTTIPYTPPPTQAAPTPKPKPRVSTGTQTKPPTPPPTTPTPEPTTKVTPPLRPPEPQAPIVIRESAVAAPDEKEEEPPKEEEGFFSRLFGGSKRYTYLTPSIRRAIDRASIRKGRWRYIVVHNSGTRQGNAKAFEHYHRYVRKMPNGMAYHFVIGNGTSSGNGLIEIGNRWHRQIQGGHVHSDYLNNIALGICFVGDFNNGQPTKAQLAAAEELVNYLRGRVGRVGGQKAAVRPHKAINPPRWPTDCPGDDFPYTWFRRF